MPFDILLPMHIDRRTFITSTLALGLLPLGGIAVAQSDGVADGDVALEGTEWQLSRMAARPWDMTIGFGPDGVLTVATPCFDAAGSYAARDGQIEIEAAKVDGGTADDPACDVLQGAGGDLLLEALGDAQQWAIDEAGILTIYPGSGIEDHELTLEPLAAPPPPDASLPGAVTGTWVLVEVIAQTGEPAPLPEGLEITLELDGTGSLSGSGGCSAYAGSYGFDESGLMTVAGLTAEEPVDCDPLLQNWQSEFVRLLGSVDQPDLDGERLVLGTDPWGFDLVFEPVD